MRAGMRNARTGGTKRGRKVIPVDSVEVKRLRAEGKSYRGHLPANGNLGRHDAQEFASARRGVAAVTDPSTQRANFGLRTFDLGGGRFRFALRTRPSISFGVILPSFLLSGRRSKNQAPPASLAGCSLSMSFVLPLSYRLPANCPLDQWAERRAMPQLGGRAPIHECCPLSAH